MNEETIVAIYDTAAEADAVTRDLAAANVPASAISRYPSSDSIADAAPTVPREQGFWASLFGGEPDHDTTVYDRTVESGGHVVTVRVAQGDAASVVSILERHHPIDIDERVASYGEDAAGTTVATTEDYRATSGAAVPMRDAVAEKGEERLQLAEEQLNVGKRLVNRGTTRIRRFVVEQPVEQDVTLHSERVTVERRPVSDELRAGEGFADKIIEVTETDEEPVVGKTARVKEEVVVRKEAADRVETVRDKVRREDVEITNDDRTATDTGSPSSSTGSPPRR
jgi:uncharacterized protein (TIGR02271 family)